VLNFFFCFSSSWWVFPIQVLILHCVALYLAALCVFVFPYVGYVTGHVWCWESVFYWSVFKDSVSWSLF
jgi:hypothetical protein